MLMMGNDNACEVRFEMFKSIWKKKGRSQDHSLLIECVEKFKSKYATMSHEGV